MSSEGNEQVRDEYVEKNPKAVKGLSFAYSTISGFKFIPVYDPKDSTKVVGTSVIFLNQSDFGGSFPKWVLQKFAPAGICEFYEDLLNEARLP